MTPSTSVFQGSLVCLLLLLLGGCHGSYHLTGPGVRDSDLDFLDNMRASRHLVVQVKGHHFDGSLNSEAPFNQYLEEALKGSGVFRSVTMASPETFEAQLAENENNPLAVTVMMSHKHLEKEGEFVRTITSPLLLIYTGLMVDIVRAASWEATFSPEATAAGIALAVVIPSRSRYMLNSKVRLEENGVSLGESKTQDKFIYNRGLAAGLFGKKSNVTKRDSAQRTALQIIRLLRNEAANSAPAERF